MGSVKAVAGREVGERKGRSVWQDKGRGRFFGWCSLWLRWFWVFWVFFCSLLLLVYFIDGGLLRKNR